jgi:hypothetical protein
MVRAMVTAVLCDGVYSEENFTNVGRAFIGAEVEQALKIP